MLLIGRTAASVEARTTPRNSEMDRPASRGFTAWTRLARLFTTFGRLARSHSPTRNVLILPKDSAWFRLAAQILETRSRADGLAPAPPCVAFRHRDVLTLWIEQSGSHRSVRPKGTFVGRPNVRAYDGFRATGSSPCPRLQCRITRTRQLRRKTRNHHMQSPGVWSNEICPLSFYLRQVRASDLRCLRSNGDPVAGGLSSDLR